MKTCKKCVLNSDDSIYFKINAESGVCNFCEDFERKWNARKSSEERSKELQQLVGEIKSQKGKYNCLLGLSGGVDSSYLAWWAHEQGLRPLIVHFDNGWNSELAVQNIQNICSQLSYDLKTIVIDWQEFKSLQLAYLKAGVIDIEVLTDHAIYATITKLAKKNGLKYIISGFNMATEGIMPKDWVYDKRDWVNIKDIALKFGSIKKFKTFPHVSFFQGLFNHFFHQLNIVQPLNLLDYNKQEAKSFLQKELGWRDYGGKHYESVFTKFYQAYILPQKFGVDKRKAHLATLIGSGQLTKKEALEELEKTLYSQAELAEDMEYFLKKMGLDEKDFMNLMKKVPVTHEEFASDKSYWKRYFRILSGLTFWKKKQS